MTMVGGLFNDNDDDDDDRDTMTKLADSHCKQVLGRVTTKLQDKIPPTTLYRWSKRTPVVR